MTWLYGTREKLLTRAELATSLPLCTYKMKFNKIKAYSSKSKIEHTHKKKEAFDWTFKIQQRCWGSHFSHHKTSASALRQNEQHWSCASHHTILSAKVTKRRSSWKTRSVQLSNTKNENIYTARFLFFYPYILFLFTTFLHFVFRAPRKIYYTSCWAWGFQLEYDTLTLISEEGTEVPCIPSRAFASPPTQRGSRPWRARGERFVNVEIFVSVFVQAMGWGGREIKGAPLLPPPRKKMGFWKIGHLDKNRQF